MIRTVNVKMEPHVSMLKVHVRARPAGKIASVTKLATRVSSAKIASKSVVAKMAGRVTM